MITNRPRMDASDYRLVAARARHRRQIRLAKIAAALVVLVPPAFLLYAKMRPASEQATASTAPAERVANAPPPVIVLTWPKPKFSQRMAPGSTVLVRRGQPFAVTVANADSWDLQWDAGNVQTNGPHTDWSPQQEDAVLKLRFRPTVGGWRKVTRWLQPWREIKLRGIVAKNLDSYRQHIAPPRGGVWVAPLVFAPAELTWDERALPLLAPDGEAATPDQTPHAIAWTLLPSFDGSTRPDTATNARMSAPDLEQVLATRARGIVRKAPDVSLKFLLRLDRQPPEGRVRLAFDGKRQRLGWIKRAGQAAGVPVQWWPAESATPNSTFADAAAADAE